jgi:hypothetical protein
MIYVAGSLILNGIVEKWNVQTWSESIDLTRGFSSNATMNLLIPYKQRISRGQ